MPVIRLLSVILNKTEEKTMLSKNTLLIALLASTLGLAACSEPEKESAEEMKEEAVQVASDAKEETADMLEGAKEEASVALEDAKENAEEMKEEAAAKIKEACITAKEKLGQSTDDC